jgi:hypothetical protein
VPKKQLIKILQIIKEVLFEGYVPHGTLLIETGYCTIIETVVEKLFQQMQWYHGNTGFC